MKTNAPPSNARPAPTTTAEPMRDGRKDAHGGRPMTLRECADAEDGGESVGAPQERAGGYIRFKGIPERGYSLNHRACMKADRHRDDPNRHEHCEPLAGVSVWRAAVIDGQVHALVPVNELAANDFAWGIKEGWQWVTGDCVGLGPVGEPLLRNARPASPPAQQAPHTAEDKT